MLSATERIYGVLQEGSAPDLGAFDYDDGSNVSTIWIQRNTASSDVRYSLDHNTVLLHIPAGSSPSLIQTYVSKSVTQMLGFTPEELTDIPVIEKMIHPDDQAAVQEAFRKLLNREAVTVQYRHRHKSGEWIWLEARACNQLENEVIRGIIAATRDITAQKKRRRHSLRVSGDLWLYLMQHSSLSVY